MITLGSFSMFAILFCFLLTIRSLMKIASMKHEERMKMIEKGIIPPVDHKRKFDPLDPISNLVRAFRRNQGRKVVNNVIMK